MFIDTMIMLSHVFVWWGEGSVDGGGFSNDFNIKFHANFSKLPGGRRGKLVVGLTLVPLAVNIGMKR
jgi:hypothetical protein